MSDACARCGGSGPVRGMIRTQLIDIAVPMPDLDAPEKKRIVKNPVLEIPLESPLCEGCAEQFMGDFADALGTLTGQDLMPLPTSGKERLQ